ncbi:STAS domain-containing protein [Geodermatophilus sp. YIM 151500]|uniref:STAS domain-containing protein n=1 Tax=Geodermatophilus sp. YIM 151500 TaxID=2984531 RepID=UPI0021E3A4B3|nr:STAS domain-containing protein [Geodermatophilus sp. YIM 151500]MCV2488123.1 STAS domain-containing protein [Geodermatophilus sp. YIM 151500]
MEQPTSSRPPGAQDQHPATPSPEPAGSTPDVGSSLEGGTARLTVAGELTDAARRPLVRVVTDLLLAEHELHRVELDLRRVSFANSAGLAVLVQVQKLVAPRAIGLVLVGPPPAVVRSLQLTGLWHRFTVHDVAP